MNKRGWLIGIVILLIAALACGASGGGDSTEIESTGESPEEAPQAGSISAVTDFPLPPKYENFMEVQTSVGGVNFQTPMSIEDVVAFYREEFGEKLGYSERDYLTNIADDNFQLVFDGHPSGIPIVIQGVNLGNSTNVNIRFEDA